MSGRPAVWVLLRGLSRESGHWGAFPAVLHQQLQTLQPGAELVLLDLPGNGVLHRQASPMQVPAMVEACRDQLTRRGVAGPVHLLAMSLGAMVVSDWVDRYPDEVSGAVLINTSLRPFSPFYRRLRPLNYLTLLLLSLSSRSARQREARVLGMTTRLLPPARRGAGRLGRLAAPAPDGLAQHDPPTAGRRALPRQPGAAVGTDAAAVQQGGQPGRLALLAGDQPRLGRAAALAYPRRP